MNLESLSDLYKKICETDVTELKQKIGGNACTSVSFALAEAVLKVFNEPLFVYFQRISLEKRLFLRSLNFLHLSLIFWIVESMLEASLSFKNL